MAILPPSVLASELAEPVGLVDPVDLTIADTTDVLTKLQFLLCAYSCNV